MRCRVCGKKAEIFIKSHHIALCRSDFIEFFKRRVKKALSRWKMCSKDEKILVAVSGGKDSLTAWHVLLQLGYQADGLFIDLGIGENSAKAKEKVISFAEKVGRKLILIDIKEHFAGMGIPDIVRRVKEPACKICGRIKRYFMEKAAEGYDCIATGHNIDDETAFLLGNILHWKEEFLARQAPVLKEEWGFKRKIKPLVLCSELETAAYAFFMGIDYYDEPCPLAEGATSIFYKKIMNEIENEMPGTKIRFYQGFQERRQLFQKEEEPLPAKPCRICGYPTSAGICAVCRLKIRLGILEEPAEEDHSPM